MRTADYSLLRNILQAIVLGVVYYFVASPTAQMEEPMTLAAIAWPAPTLAIALLWRLPYRQWLPYLVAVFWSMTLVGELDWLPLETDFAFAALNVLEIVLCAWLGKRYVNADGDLDTLAQLIRFLLLLPLLAMLPVAALGATIAASAMHVSWWYELRAFMISNGLAVLVLVPALLAWRRAGRRNPGYLITMLGVTGIAAALAATTIFNLSEEVFRVMLSLIMVSVAIYGGVRSASIAVGAAGVGGILLTLYGLGPYRHGGIDSVWPLQVDLAGLAILSFLVAVAARERQQLAVRLEQARRFESLGLLAGGIAHDFNNILGAVGGYAEMADERLGAGSPAQAPLREVTAAVARGKELTEQILLAARRGDRQRVTLDLRDAAREAVALATPLCRPGVVIGLRLPEHPLPVLAHRNQMIRALLNLTRNASQAARANVTVTLGSGIDAGDYDLSIGDIPSGAAVWADIADDGSGIAPEHMQQLFDPFFSTKTGPGGKGTGLGLAIVAGVATEHGGGVGVGTRSGQGTHFRFMLPLATDGVIDAPDALNSPTRHARAAGVDPDGAAAPIGQGERVLVLDDDPAWREICEDWLAELGFEPVGYGDPLAVLELAASAPDDLFLLLTDLEMPALRGDEVSQRLREMAPELPVIICSGSPEGASAARAAGAVALAKPCDRESLAAAVNQAISRRQERKSS